MMTPKLVPLPSSNFHTTPMGGRLSLGIFNALQLPLHGRSSAVRGSNSRHAVYESVTLTTWLPRPLKS
ncbi:hypothetical protein TNCV_654131 [Trichonephila clavipes]|nr:hypothetical protein TNCV_654131 [Trichonephila clavipes]